LSPQQQLVSPQRQQSQPVGSQQVLAAAGSIGSTHTPGALGATAPQMVDASGHLQTRSYSTHRARGSVVQVQTSPPGVPLQQRYGAAPVYMQQHPGIPTGASPPTIQCDHETMRSDELLAAMLGVSQAGSAGSGGGFAEGLGVGSRFLPVAPTEPTAAASTATTVAAVPASSTPVPSGRSGPFGAATFVVAGSSAAVPVGPGRGRVPARGPVLLAGGQPPMTVRGQAAGPMVGGWQKVVGGSALAPAGLVRCSSPQVWSGARSPSQPLPPHLMQDASYGGGVLQITLRERHRSRDGVGRQGTGHSISSTTWASETTQCACGSPSTIPACTQVASALMTCSVRL